MKIGLIGCGFIGTTIAKAIDSEIEQAELTAVCDVDDNKIKNLIEKLRKKPKIMQIDELIQTSDLVIEAASANIVENVLKKCRKLKKDIMIMSIGGLIDVDLSKIKDINVYLPSGAIGSLDALKSASEKKIESVVLTTTKSPKSLGRDDIKEKTTLFEGNVNDAIEKFPKNINVSAALALTAGKNKVKVRIICDPKTTKNTHEIEVKGDFGKYEFKVENVPSPDNPKTSYLAALSAVRCLKNIFENVKIGN